MRSFLAAPRASLAAIGCLAAVLAAGLPVRAQDNPVLAKVNGDDALLERSRLPALEKALARTLIPAKRDLVGAAEGGGLHGASVHKTVRFQHPFSRLPQHAHDGGEAGLALR